jgi:hypothetical protein
MDFLRSKAKQRHDHELKVVVGGYIHAVARCTGVFTKDAVISK